MHEAKGGQGASQSRRFVAAATLLMVLASGCSYGVYFGAPRRTVSGKAVRVAEVAVRTSPAGARVEAEGEELGEAPLTYRGRYDVRWRYRQRSNTLAIAACGVDLLLALGASAYIAQRTDENVPLSIAGGFALMNLTCGTGLMLTQVENRRAAARPAEEIVPREVEFRVHWTGGDTAAVNARLPEDQVVRARRAPRDPFDEALIEWYRAVGQEPAAPEGLYNLAVAFQRRAESSGRMVDFHRALGLFTRYLETPDTPRERRADASRRVERIRTALGESR